MNNKEESGKTHIMGRFRSVSTPIQLTLYLASKTIETMEVSYQIIKDPQTTVFLDNHLHTAGPLTGIGLTFYQTTEF